MDKYLLVLVGGAIGSLARYLAGTAVMSRFTGRFPLGTLVVNVTGCFLIGAVMTLLTQKSANPNWRMFLVVGFLGGYTTFSSFEWEAYSSIRGGDRWMGLLYVTGSVMLGYAAVWLGSAIAARR